MINVNTVFYSWTVEQNNSGHWELVYWIRGDHYGLQKRELLRSDNYQDAVIEGKYALYT